MTEKEQTTMSDTPTQAVVLERLSKGEAAYHRKLIAEVERTNYAWERWKQHLSEEYHYPPGTVIDPDGIIHRPTLPTVPDPASV